MQDDVQLILADRIVGTARGQVITAGYLALKNGRVLETGPAAAAAEKFPASIPREHFPGCTIIPGLVDSHVHLTFSAGPVPFEDLQAANDHELLLRAAVNARAALQAGVTTLRDLGSRGSVIFDLRDAIAKGIIPGPRILASGSPITQTRGSGRGSRRSPALWECCARLQERRRAARRGAARARPRPRRRPGCGRP